MTYNHICGTSTLSCLRLWFNTKAQRKWLSKQGYVLRKFDVDPKTTQRGRFQTIFIRSKAMIIETRDLKTL